MSLVSPVASWLSTFLPAYDAARVASVSETIGEPVLWSGRAFPPEAVQASMESLSWCLVGSLAFVLVGLGIAAYAFRTRYHGYYIGAGIGVFVGLIGLASFNDTLKGTGYVMASRGYVITQNRLVRIDPEGQRRDVPANAVTSITRQGDLVTIDLVRMSAVQIQADTGGKAMLDGALDRFAANAFKGDGFVGTLNGRS